MCRIWPASDACSSTADVIYPQFATHNAHSIAAVLELAPADADYEFQRLHGMGRLLYAEAARQVANFPRVRIYAPVGEHKDLLAYLVRRLLENGANTSFVNRFMDEQVPVAEIVRDPISELERLESYAIPGCRYPQRCIPIAAIPVESIWEIRAEIEMLRTEISVHRAGAGRSRPRVRSSMVCCCRQGACRDQSGGSPRSSRQHARRDSRGNQAGVRCRRRGSGRLEFERRRGARRIVSKRRRICSSRTARTFTNCWFVKRARRSRTPSRRCARPRIFVATMLCGSQAVCRTRSPGGPHR